MSVTSIKRAPAPFRAANPPGTRVNSTHRKAFTQRKTEDFLAQRYTMVYPWLFFLTLLSFAFLAAIVVGLLPGGRL